jgi:hypothetical protein
MGKQAPLSCMFSNCFEANRGPDLNTEWSTQVGGAVFALLAIVVAFALVGVAERGSASSVASQLVGRCRRVWTGELGVWGLSVGHCED